MVGLALLITHVIILWTSKYYKALQSVSHWTECFESNWIYSRIIACRELQLLGHWQFEVFCNLCIVYEMKTVPQKPNFLSFCSHEITEIGVIELVTTCTK